MSAHYLVVAAFSRVGTTLVVFCPLPQILSLALSVAGDCSPLWDHKLQSCLVLLLVVQSVLPVLEAICKHSAAACECQVRECPGDNDLLPLRDAQSFTWIPCSVSFYAPQCNFMAANSDPLPGV